MKLAIYFSELLSNVLLIVDKNDQYGIIKKDAGFITSNFTPNDNWDSPLEII